MTLSVLKNNILNLGVAPLGAEMQYLRTSSGDDLLWHGDGKFWTGRAPVLFPIVGRAVEDKIAIGEHSSAMPQHGFARRCSFALQEQTDTMCRHVLRDTTETRAAYPFAFTLEITHHLEGHTLHVSAKVTNSDTRPMPFGFGFHPAFVWPLPTTSGAAHHVTLEDKSNASMRALDDGLLRPEALDGPFKNGDLEILETLFDNGALVFPNGAAPLRYGPKFGPALSFTFHNLPDLALWRPSGAPFLCIEPWHGTASYVGDTHQIADRPNSINLSPNASAEFGYSVSFTAQ